MFEPVAETARFIVIDKAAGTSFHQEDGQPGLASLIREACALPELYPVHRLDKATSGLMVFAKDVDAARALAQAFERHEVEKRYLALSERAPKKKQGWIRGDMLRSRNGQWRLTHSQNHPAITWFVSRGLGEGQRLFMLRPYTGRTHQLRVAMKSLGSPILGDTLYNPGSDADRLYLHAWWLGFRLDGATFRYLRPPASGRHFDAERLSAPLAEWMQRPTPEV